MEESSSGALGTVGCGPGAVSGPRRTVPPACCFASVAAGSAAEAPGGLVEVDETYVGGHERGRRGGREVLHKSIVAVAVEQRAHSAGRARLSVLKGVRFEQDLSPFIQAGIRHWTVELRGSPPRSGKTHRFCQLPSRT